MNLLKVKSNFFARYKAVFKLITAQNSVYIKGFKKYDLVIFDDIFPNPISGFRVEEFKILLQTIPNSKILSIPYTYNYIGASPELHRNHIDEFSKENPLLKNKITTLKRFNSINTKLFYCVFLNNILRYVDVLERKKINFAFTLYPGGGFQINDELTDAKLKRVMASTMFKKVIVTQSITKNYLLEKGFCNKEKIEFIFGGVVPQKTLIKNITNKYYYLQGKETLDICFCAGKYMPRGLDKGYDVFIELAHLLSYKYNFVHFHIIGGFDEKDIDISKIKENSTFYGYQKFEDLEKIFKNIDILISPNKPFLLDKGAFDGFPLGTVIEAALNEVLVLTSDNLNLNTLFVDNEELIIIESECVNIEKKIIHLLNNPALISKIAKKGKLKFQEVYSNKIQMEPRIELLKKIINKL